MDPRPELIITSFDEKEINEYIEKLNQITMTYGQDQSIIVKIDSFGGSTHGLSNLFEALKTVKNPIITYTTSKAMSAGAILLSAAGSPGMRFASPNSSIMLHEISAGTIGHIEDMENEISMFKANNEQWLGILAKSMGMKNSQDIRNLIKTRGTGRELYLTAEEAKELNVVDNIGYLDISPIMGYNVNVTLAAPAKKQKRKK